MRKSKYITMAVLFLIVGGGIFLLLPAEKKGKKRNYPAEWAWTQRTFPFGTFDKNAYNDALAYRRIMDSALKKGVEVSWEFAGPENIGGRIVDIEYDPKNPNILYAGSATGGVFKSEDGGVNWQAIFDEQAVLTVGDIAVDPVNSDIIYVGTGEANGGHNNFPGSGMFKSVDAGQTWEFIGLGETVSIGRVLVDPANPQKIIVAAVGSYFDLNPERGVYISPDGGQTWEQSLFISDSTGAIDIVMDTQNPQFLIAAMWERVRRPVYAEETHLYGKSSGVYKSTDGGESWNLLTSDNGLPDAQLENVGRIGLALYSGEQGRVIYALYNDGSYLTGLYRSDDDGATWLESGGMSGLSNGSSSFSWYFGQVRVHPQNPDIVFVLDVSFMRSEDGGATWPVSYGYSGLSQLHVDHHALAFHPHNPDSIASGNDGGFNLSWNGGYSWNTSPNLPVSQFYEIGLDYSNPERLYGGTQDNGTIRTNSGQLADWENILGGDGFYVLVSWDDPDVIYAESQWGALAKSTNGGENFSGVINSTMSSEPTNWSTPVVMDPQNPDVLYYGTNRIWRTEDAARNWTAISPVLTRELADSRLGTVTTIAVAPGNSTVIYAGTDDGQVWVSPDYGVEWINITGTLPFRWVTRLAVDPIDESIVYVTFSGLKWAEPQSHVFRSEDYGTNWQDISTGLPDAPVNAIAIDPFEPANIYLGTDIGAYFSLNSGQTWDVLGSGLPVVVINDLKVHPANHRLVAGTHARSMYTLDLDLLTGIAPRPPVVAEFKLYQNYPNPFNSKTVISYQLSAFSEVDLSIYNILGQKVATLVSMEQQAGDHKVDWDATKFASGVYLYQLKANKGFVQTRKLLLQK